MSFILSIDIKVLLFDWNYTFTGDEKLLRVLLQFLSIIISSWISLKYLTWLILWYYIQSCNMCIYIDNRHSYMMSRFPHILYAPITNIGRWGSSTRWWAAQRWRGYGHYTSLRLRRRPYPRPVSRPRWSRCPCRPSEREIGRVWCPLLCNTRVKPVTV